MPAVAASEAAKFMQKKKEIKVIPVEAHSSSQTELGFDARLNWPNMTVKSN